MDLEALNLGHADLKGYGKHGALVIRYFNSVYLLMVWVEASKVPGNLLPWVISVTEFP